MAQPTYEYSGVCYTATSGQIIFALTSTDGNPIGYLSPLHIHVRSSADSGETWKILQVGIDWVFGDSAVIEARRQELLAAGEEVDDISDPTTIVLTTPATGGEWIDIQRKTPIDEDWVDFQAGSLLTAGQLNDAETFSLYCDQEISDSVSGLTPLVSQIVAGENITISPTDGTGQVTINASGGGGAVDSVNGQTGDVVLDAADVGAIAVGGAVTKLTAGSNITLSPASGTGEVEISAAGGGGGGAVDSVNGQTGDVVLDAADVGALPSSYSAPVSSVNSKTGDVVLTASDVGALPDTYVPPAAPVVSVNGETGVVVLDASDVGALPSSYAAPVDSVNSKTGAVVLNAADVGALGVTATAVDSDKLGGKPASDYVIQSEIADVWEFKGIIDPTTENPPANPDVGDIYASDVAGQVLPIWNVTADGQPNPNPIGGVAVGSLIGRGYNQWALIGEANAEVLQNLDQVLAQGNTSSRDINLTGDITAGDITANAFSGDGSGLTNVKVDDSTLPTASTSQAGIVQLTDSISSTSTTTAATPSSVKDAYDHVATYAPSKTGSGASGTWGISISGNAATASSASSSSSATDSTNCSRSVTGSNGLSGGGVLNSDQVISGINATTSAKGVVQLTDSASSTSTTTAATPNAVKAAYDRGSLGVTNAATAQSKADAALPKAGGTITGNLTVNGTISGDGSGLTNLPAGATNNLQAVTDAGNTTTNGASFADGACSITSAGNQQWGGAPFQGQAGTYASISGTVYTCPSSTSNAAFSAYEVGTTNVSAAIKGDGSALFKGVVQVGGNAVSGTANGIYLDKNGVVNITRGDGSSIFLGYKQGTSSPTFAVSAAGQVTAAGSASFGGDVTVGDASNANAAISKNGALYLNYKFGGASTDIISIKSGGSLENDAFSVDQYGSITAAGQVTTSAGFVASNANGYAYLSGSSTNALSIYASDNSTIKTQLGWDGSITAAGTVKSAEVNGYGFVMANPSNTAQTSGGLYQTDVGASSLYLKNQFDVAPTVTLNGTDGTITAKGYSMASLSQL